VVKSQDIVKVHLYLLITTAATSSRSNKNSMYFVLGFHYMTLCQLIRIFPAWTLLSSQKNASSSSC